jgi:hypothetical protein
MRYAFCMPRPFVGSHERPRPRTKWVREQISGSPQKPRIYWVFLHVLVLVHVVAHPLQYGHAVWKPLRMKL